MFEFLKRLFLPKSKNFVLGRNAENFACKYIKRNTTYKLLLRNFRYRNYEVDILCYDKEVNCLVIVEVKARRDNALVGGYFSALGESKMRSVLACKNAYMKISPHKFDSFSYNIFEVMHNEEGKIMEYFFHENIPICKKRSR